jgi:hypothetical protein
MQVIVECITSRMRTVQDGRGRPLAILPVWMTVRMIPQGGARENLTFVPVLFLIPRPYFLPEATFMRGGWEDRRRIMLILVSYVFFSSGYMHF